MAARIPEDVIEKVRDEVAIEEVVGHFLPLQRAGKDFKALCPFHQEKTPSFHVVPDKQIFYCFGCQRGGNVYRFLMDRQGMSFPEAVEWCAHRIGLDLSRYLSEDEERDSGRALLLAANAWAAEWFAQKLAAPGGAVARRYLRSRGVLPETIDAFGLGFAPEAGGELVADAGRAGLAEEALLQASLLQRREGRAPFAYFRSRLIFAVRGPARKVHGFGGRILGQGEPKYLNSPENPVFQKRAILYGLPEARASIVRNRMAVLVEGYFDALALHQLGYTHTVATCGTAFTQQQARVLARYAERVTLVFDGDRAGLKAAFRAADEALAAGLDVRIARLPEGTDPGDYLSARDADALRAAVEQAPGLVACMAAEVSARGDRREMKERALHHLQSTLKKVADPIRAELLVQEAAAAFNVPEALLRPGSAGGEPPPPPSRPRAGEREKLERDLLQLALSSAEALRRLLEVGGTVGFTAAPAREIYAALGQRTDESSPAVDAGLLSGLSEEASNLAARLMTRSLPEDFDAVAELTAVLQRIETIDRREDNARRLEDLQQKYATGGDWRALLEDDAASHREGPDSVH